MNIHIVCVDDHHIVPRMSRWLVDAHGWSMSDRPDDTADVNFYMPYTMLAQGRARARAKTKTAAWFTHFEEMTPGKVLLWNRAADVLDLRLVTAPIYAYTLDAHGPTALVTPGVDREHFTPGEGGREPGLIGVSGIGHERKGVLLARYLYADGYRIEAAGHNWQIPESFVSYEAMAGFYRRLDVLLCTSLVEGIPAPPFEALACGTKVVVPADVGALNLLPEQPGIRHYAAGDYQDMQRAIEMAQTDEVEPAELRAVTEPYGIDAWCESVGQALEVLA